MKTIVLLGTVAVWLTALPGTAEPRTWLISSAPPTWQEVRSESLVTQAVRLRNHLNGILAAKCQSTYTRSLAGTDFRVWVKRHIAAHRAKNACVDIRDWRTAVMYVQQWFPGTAQWLLDCSSSEGGHGIWVWNGGAPYGSSSHGSGAGGWMQYMSGTFYGDFHQAVAYLSARGVRVPSSADSWYSPLGQAIAAGWARYTGHTPPGKWTGASC